MDLQDLKVNVVGDRRIVIVGKTGNGKSSLGNNLLGDKIFDDSGNFDSVTEKCHLGTKPGLYKKEGDLTIVDTPDLFRPTEYEKEGDLTIVDTPGLFRPTDEKSMAEQSLEILESLNICKSPHAFLLVIRNDCRWSQEDLFTKDALEIIFGPEFLQHAIIVITHVDNKITDSDFEEKWRKSQKLTSLIESCGKRVARIDNTNLEERYIENILLYVNEVSENGTKAYSYAFQDCTKKTLENIVELGSYDGKKAHEQVTYISKDMKKAIETEQIMTELNRKVADLKDRERVLAEREMQNDEMLKKRLNELSEWQRNAEEIIKYKEELARNKEAEGDKKLLNARNAKEKAKEKVEAAERYANSKHKVALVATVIVGVAAAATGGITGLMQFGAIKAGLVTCGANVSSYVLTHLAFNGSKDAAPSKKKNS